MSGTAWTVRLAIVNSIGFSATTIMPLWIAALPSTLGLPAWQIGLVATAQLIACGLFNVASPWLFGRLPPLIVARFTLIVATVAGLLQATALTAASLPAFAAAALVSGAVLGVLLGMTNRIMAGVSHVQKGYAVFQIVEVCFASALYLGSAGLLDRLGPQAIFVLMAITGAGGVAALHGLAAPRSGDGHAPLVEVDRPRFLHGALLLIAMLCFFSGQSSINSFVIQIGHDIGLDAASVAQIVGTGMICALAGAAAARLMGERFGTTVPIVVVALLLAADFLFLTRSPSPTGFALGVGFIPLGTIMAVPFFFTALARVDARGRFAAVGPAFLLGGVALGPLISTALDGAIGRVALGVVAGSLMTVAGLLAFAHRRRKPTVPASRQSIAAFGPE
ncbi:MFS transporter [Glacieibacterium sp.]|uniref:MFS transporter n=1 Tax=Glacieibacterium sp. TaxID=2860237 RepID=UPI003B00D615